MESRGSRPYPIDGGHIRTCVRSSNPRSNPNRQSFLTHRDAWSEPWRVSRLSTPSGRTTNSPWLTTLQTVLRRPSLFSVNDARGLLTGLGRHHVDSSDGSSSSASGNASRTQPPRKSYVARQPLDLPRGLRAGDVILTVGWRNRSTTRADDRSHLRVGDWTTTVRVERGAD